MTLTEKTKNITDLKIAKGIRMGSQTQRLSDSRLKTEVETGTVVLFPATWNYLHKGNPVTGGHAKYILGTFTNYVKKQKLNRVGDKTLGAERL